MPTETQVTVFPTETSTPTTLRRCRADERAAMLAIIQAAAEAYRGVIPDDCWHEPYMSAPKLDEEIAAGVEFWGCQMDGALIGVMGVQTVRGVDLIRHAYVMPGQQGRGIGAALIAHLRHRSTRRMLVGTWSAATWAIGFYRRNGFELASPAQVAPLLRTYWSVSERQIETSVVLVDTARGLPAE